MPYKGKRDDYVRIRVPQSLCNKITLKSGDFIEIAVPASVTTDSWESWMVKEDQVFWDRNNPNTHNIIDKINDKTDIILLTKCIRDGKRVIIEDSERVVSPSQLAKMYENL